MSVLPEDVSKYGKHLIAAGLARRQANAIIPTLLLSRNDSDWDLEEWLVSKPFVEYRTVLDVCIDALARLKMEKPIELPEPIEQVVAKRIEQIEQGGAENQVPIISIVESLAIGDEITTAWLAIALDRLLAVTNTQEGQLPRVLTKGLPARQAEQLDASARNIAISHRCVLFIVDNELGPEAEDFLDGYISTGFTRQAAISGTPQAETVKQLRLITKTFEASASDTSLGGP